MLLSLAAAAAGGFFLRASDTLLKDCDGGRGFGCGGAEEEEAAAVLDARWSNEAALALPRMFVEPMLFCCCCCCC